MSDTGRSSCDRPRSVRGASLVRATRTRAFMVCTMHVQDGRHAYRVPCYEYHAMIIRSSSTPSRNMESTTSQSRDWQRTPEYERHTRLMPSRTGAVNDPSLLASLALSRRPRSIRPRGSRLGFLAPCVHAALRQAWHEGPTPDRLAMLLACQGLDGGVSPPLHVAAQGVSSQYHWPDSALGDSRSLMPRTR